MEGIKPSEIFNAFLLDKYQRGQTSFQYNIIGLHKAFYEAHLRNPKIMENYDFTKYTNPYSQTLDGLIKMFHLTGSIMIGLDGLIYIKNLKDINEPKEEVKNVVKIICDSLETDKKVA